MLLTLRVVFHINYNTPGLDGIRFEFLSIWSVKVTCNVVAASAGDVIAVIPIIDANTMNLVSYIRSPKSLFAMECGSEWK